MYILNAIGVDTRLPARTSTPSLGYISRPLVSTRSQSPP